MADLDVEIWRDAAGEPRKLQERIHTTSEGVLRVGGLEGKSYTLIPKGKSVPMGWQWRRLKVQADQDKDLGDLTIPRPASVRGRVVDELQRPLSRIRIFHVYRTGYSISDFGRRLLPGTKGIPESVLTDVQGRFRFDDLSPGDNGFLAESPLFQDHAVLLEVGEGSSTDLGTWVLHAGREIRGRVVDRAGRGIAKVLVSPKSLYEVYRRKGMRTDAAGNFVLRGLDASIQELQVEAKTWQVAIASVDWEKKVQDTIVLEPEAFLLGRVENTEGKKTTVQLHPNSGLPFHVWMALSDPLPVAIDGTFRAGGLLPGKYTAIAKTRGLGKSEKIEFKFHPGMDPLVLVIRRNHRLPVEIVDDLGHPIARARLVRDPGIAESPSLYKQGDPGLPKKILTGWRGRQLVAPRTDSDGKADLLYPVEEALAVAADAPLHLPAARVFLAGQVPQRLRLTLPRAARIRGRVLGLKPNHRPSASVVFTPLPKPDSMRPARNSGIDSQGGFQVDQLAPGTYRVGIRYFNMTWYSKPGEAGEGATPILGEGVDPRSWKRIEIGPGPGEDILLPTPALGSISGIVRDTRGPVGEAIVFAVPAGTQAERSPLGGTVSFDSPDAHSFQPFIVTDKEGRFQFDYVNPGSWDLRVHAKGAVAATNPVRVDVRSPAQHVQQDLALGSTSIHGSFDTSQLGDKARKGLSVYLIRARLAGEDPFYSAHGSLPQISDFKTIRLDARGGFSLPYLPPGQWILRLISGRTLLWQKWLDITGQRRIDLVDVKPAPKKNLDITIQLPPISENQKEAAATFGSSGGYGLWIRERISGRKVAIWHDTVRVKDGKNRLALAAGSYQLELFEAYAGVLSMGISGESRGQSRAIEVMADGRVQPALIDFR